MSAIFTTHTPQQDDIIPFLKEGLIALEKTNRALGLALSADELDYIATSFNHLKRNPTAAELMMFAQANSEHCRHKVFNASWTIDGEGQKQSLFAMIKETYKKSATGVLSAYKDNAAVLTGATIDFYHANQKGQYQFTREPIHTVLKVETHNHPTAISPHPGAATGIGGEIRDEAATGRGAKSIAGLTGFCVSHLQIPQAAQPWEEGMKAAPTHMASALEIMLAGPIGGAAYSNEFGRPNLLGYFRTFYQTQSNTLAYGYHKPIMLAGGIGHIRASQVQKLETPAQALVIVLGGPAMLIGLGGGAASSMAAAIGKEELDFASVQRANPEMQRRAQEVINQCWARGEDNPILAIHDVGAGGLANAVPEILYDSNRGGDLQLRAILNNEPSMSPMAVWCNESQERYVLTVKPQHLKSLETIAQRERCPLAVLGHATQDFHLKINDSLLHSDPVDVPMDWLFGHPPKMHRESQRQIKSLESFDVSALDLNEGLTRLLQFPAVASKQFLVTIGDRSVTGLVARDQMVGPWQVPVADCAVTTLGFKDVCGTAVAMGERSPLAVLDASASVRMALGEAITNLMTAPINSLEAIRASANWMAAVNETGEDAALFDAVQSLSELSQQLKLCIPVGKDSLSMRTQWSQQETAYRVVSPVSLNITLSAPVADVRQVLTPQLQKVNSHLLLVDLGLGQQRLGGSSLAQVYQQLGNECPDVNAQSLQDFFQAMRACHQQSLLLAYHDRSDGGLWATLCEMTFAGHCGVQLDITALGDDPLTALANEELGCVLQVASEHVDKVMHLFTEGSLAKHVYDLGQVSAEQSIQITHQNKVIIDNTRVHYQALWAETSYRMQALRDNPNCAAAEFQSLQQSNDPGLHAHFSFDYPLTAPNINTKTLPKVAILREQGVNGHVEMAAAFQRAGFDCVDLHMQDLMTSTKTLDDFQGLVACGGFSYGDVLGAGRGWAGAIRYHESVCTQFQNFWQRAQTFSLGVCNGCQMFSHLRDFIPGAQHWPEFHSNESEQFEARLVMVEIMDSPSILFKEMRGARLPITVAHGEGRVVWPQEKVLPAQTVMRYVDHQGQATDTYPYNPNGSVGGFTGFCNEDGRVTILMPHPERVFRTVQCSWHPSDWQEDSPWMKLFYNARAWVS